MKVFVFGRSGRLWAQDADDLVAEVAGSIVPMVPGGTVDVTLRRLVPSEGSLPQAPADSPAGAFEDELPASLITVRVHGAPDDVAEAALARLGELAPGSTSFAVDELVAVPGDGTPPPLSRLGLIARPTGKTPDQFWTHYRDVHVPMVIRGGPGFSRYSVNRVLTPTPPIDAVVEQWFASDATWREHDRQVREEKDEIRADIANFIGRYFQFRAELAASIPGCAGADR